MEQRGRVVIEEGMAGGYARRVGERLRAIRKQKGLSLQEVEGASHQEFKASVLGAYERGERAISVPRLQPLARFYNVPVDQLLPRDLGADPAWGPGDDDTDLRAAEEGNGRRMLDADDRVTIDLARLEELEAPERDMLSRYLGMIQVQRQDFNGRMLTIRGEDLRAIACLFETSAEGMRRRLSELGVRM